MNTPNPFVALVSGMGKAMPPLESGLLFQTGETADGKTPLVDRQHPHDLFMELSAAYTAPVTEDFSVKTYFGWPGEAALGPAAPDHRFSGVNIPDVPITHHWMDSTHISFGASSSAVTIPWPERSLRSTNSSWVTYTTFPKQGISAGGSVLPARLVFCPMSWMTDIHPCPWPALAS